MKTMRTCGSCSLCCTLLPVKSLGKGAGQRCKYQRFSTKGECCKVYPVLPSVAPECRVWSCRWLIGESGATSRPDRAHYVIDAMPDTVRVKEEPETEFTEVPVLQVWIDPAYPDAYRDPALRAYLAERGLCALIRTNDRDGFLLIPPSRGPQPTPDGIEALNAWRTGKGLRAIP